MANQPRGILLTPRYAAFNRAALDVNAQTNLPLINTPSKATNYDWPTPQRRLNRPSSDVNAQTNLGLLFNPPANYPHHQYDWPVPQRRLNQPWRDANYAPVMYTPFSSGNPKSQYDWPLPRRYTYPYRWVDINYQTNLNMLAPPGPLNATARPPTYYRRPPPPRDYSFTFSPIPTDLISPFVQTDWPNPRNAYREFPQALRTHLDGSRMILRGQDRFYGPPGLAPTFDWPNPQRRVYRDYTWNSFLNPQGESPPVLNFDWPLPKGYKQPDRSYIAPAQVQLLGQDRFYGPPGLAPIFDTNLPPRGNQFPISNRFWAYNSTVLLLSTIQPFNVYDWPVPQRRVGSADLRSWLYSTVGLIGQDRIYGAPGEVPSYDWPNPRGYVYPLTLRSIADQPRILLIGQDQIYGAPGQVPAYDWPNPKGYVYPTSIRDIDQFMALLHHGINPRNQFDWPLPQRTEFPRDLRFWAQSHPLGIETLPFNVYDWPNPRRNLIIDRGFVTPSSVLFELLNPVVQTDWPVPRTRPFSNELRTWVRGPLLTLPVPGHNPPVFIEHNWPPVPGVGRPYASFLRTHIDTAKPGLLLWLDHPVYPTYAFTRVASDWPYNNLADFAPYTIVAPAWNYCALIPENFMPALVPYPPMDATMQVQTVSMDFGAFLPEGVTLLGTPTFEISVSEGSDPNPSSHLSGSPRIGTVTPQNGGSGAANAAVLQQLTGLLGGVTYLVVGWCTRSDGDVASGYSHISGVTPA